MMEVPHVLPTMPARHSIVSASKSNAYGWPALDLEGIKEAQQLYDAGTHEIATKKYGSWRFLILIERSEPTRPRHYFSSQLAHQRKETSS